MPETDPTKRSCERADTSIRRRASFPKEILRAAREGLDAAPPFEVAGIRAGAVDFSALLLGETCPGAPRP